jgi:hypothetical protein
MGPKDPHSGLAPPASQARALRSLGLGTVALAIVFGLPPIPQNLNYHGFADDPTMLGMPSFLKVASNLPFLGVGVEAPPPYRECGPRLTSRRGIKGSGSPADFGSGSDKAPRSTLNLRKSPCLRRTH